MRELFSILSLSILLSCEGGYNSRVELDQSLSIYPDYDSVVVPRAIAPLNFTVKEGGDSYVFDFYNSLQTDAQFTLKSDDANLSIPEGKWNNLLTKGSPSDIKIVVSVVKDGVRYIYKPIVVDINDDTIDRYIAYRLIEPGYEYWGQMGIYQRDISSFDEVAVVENNPEDKGCVNCHSFCGNSTDRFLFHARKWSPATYISIDGVVKPFATKVGSMMGDAAYPSWHPDGRFIAFSTNITRQVFHNSGDKPVEVFDYDSDIVIYDTKTNTMFSSQLLYNEQQAESFPYWSRDGKYLYFISAPKQMAQSFDPLSIKYNLYRVKFDSQTQSFSDYELMFDAAAIGKSVATARPYHDDTKISFALCEYGSFAIWHDESDFYSLDVASRELERLDILNSDKSESYRSFSSGDSWVVFTSRRDDGLYTRLYISHYDKSSGEFSKPFMLPQRDASFNFSNEKSYNIPEFVDSKVTIQNDIESAFTARPTTIKKGKQL